MAGITSWKASIGDVTFTVSDRVTTSGVGEPFLRTFMARGLKLPVAGIADAVGSSDPWYHELESDLRARFQGLIPLIGAVYPEGKSRLEVSIDRR